MGIGGAMFQLRRLVSTLGGVPPLAYGFIYLGLIFVFAVAYLLMPDAFYHSTVQYEHDFQREEAVILTGLQAAARDGFMEVHPEGVPSDGQMRVDIAHAYFYALRAGSDTISFSVLLFPYSSTTNSDWIGFEAAPIDVT